MTNIETVLQEIPLFQLLPTSAIADLVQAGKIMAYEANEVVCYEGDETDAMYVILSGQVDIFKQGEENQKVEITQMQSGEFFGEMAMLGSQLRSATVSCLTPCRFFMLEKEAFLSLLANAETQVISLSVFSSLVRRMGALTEKYFAEELAQRTLQAKMEAKRHRTMAQMVAGVAHELNTPLGVVNMAVDMIAKRVESPQLATPLADAPAAKAILADIQEATQLAERNIQRAHKLVENFKKISVNQLTLTQEKVNIRALVSDILDLFKINARQANLNVSLNESLPAGQATWHGYPGHLTQVLTNLLFNVERYAYTTDGGDIVVKLEAEKGLFVLTVQDFGQGIAEKDLPHLFEPFFTTGRAKGGTGLGLSIVHNIVTSVLDGTIKIDSQVNHGTRVMIRFPQRIAQKIHLSDS